MSLENTSNEISEPVSRGELKSHARLGGEDDPYLERLLVAGRQAAEAETNLTIPVQTFKWITNDLCDGMKLPVYPVSSIDTFSYVDTDGATQTLASSDYSIVTEGKVSRLYTKNSSWPSLKYDSHNRVTLELTAGSLISEEQLKQAIVMICLGLNENRSDQIVGESASVDVSMSSKSLLAPYKRHLF